MDNSSQNKPFPRPILWAGACLVLLVLACGFTLAMGAGGLAIASRFFQGEKQVEGFNPQTARVDEIHGWVEVQLQDGSWEAAQDGQVIGAGQSIRTGEISSATLAFYDGSQATVNASSELMIEELDAQTTFGKRTILLSQTAGASSHKVAKSWNSDSNYEVQTPSGTGQAKGTEFEVVITPEQRAYYTVFEGVVAVTALDITVMVNPGQATYILLGYPPLEPYVTVTGQGVVSQTGETWIIAGQSFLVTESTLLMGDPQIGDWVLVYGHLEEEGSPTADQIILVRRAPTNEFTLTGEVESIGDTEWVVNGQTILVDAETEIDSGIEAGSTVRVKGVVLPGGLLQAVRIQLVEESLGQPFEFTGVLQTIDEGLWTISGVDVTVDDETEKDDTLEPGKLVHVEGYILEDGTWLAKEITAASEDAPSFEFTGTLESKDPWTVSGITFETRDWTEIDDDLNTGDRVRVEGTIDENGVWIASKIERIDETAASRLVMIGTVFSMDPWIISGIPIVVADDAVISGDIQVGMLVRVELVLQEDGTWLAVKIEALDDVVWFPGCVDVIATVVSVSGDQVQLQNWPMIQLDDDVEIEDGQDMAALVPGTVVHLRVCFGEDMVIRITYIIIIQVPTSEPVEDQSGKVMVCHKPSGKKGGHTLTISRSALPAHLGHGDYEGACR